MKNSVLMAFVALSFVQSTTSFAARSSHPVLPWPRGEDPAVDRLTGGQVPYTKAFKYIARHENAVIKNKISPFTSGAVTLGGASAAAKMRINFSQTGAMPTRREWNAKIAAAEISSGVVLAIPPAVAEAAALPVLCAAKACKAVMKSLGKFKKPKSNLPPEVVTGIRTEIYQNQAYDHGSPAQESSNGQSVEKVHENPLFSGEEN